MAIISCELLNLSGYKWFYKLQLHFQVIWSNVKEVSHFSSGFCSLVQDICCGLMQLQMLYYLASAWDTSLVRHIRWFIKCFTCFPKKSWNLALFIYDERLHSCTICRIVSEENCSSIQDAKDGILDPNKTAESGNKAVIHILQFFNFIVYQFHRFLYRKK
jgi:hypothetical protein